jgi:multiple sugar transport system permease protein
MSRAITRTFRRSTVYLLLLLTAAVFLMPVVWLLVTSLKREIEYLSWPIRFWPAVPQWINYLRAVLMGNFVRYAANSAILSTAYTSLVVIASALAGFGFARHHAPGRDALFLMVIAMLMVPSMVTVIPQFMLFSQLHMTNTYWPWILWGLSGSPFHIFLFRQFFSSIPKELEDAAEVDGCGRLRVFWQIFLPNSGPALAASAILAFNWVWGDYLYPKMFLSATNTTLAVQLVSAYGDPKGNPLVTITMAAVALFTLPLVIVFFVAQKYIIQGIVTTGFK